MQPKPNDIGTLAMRIRDYELTERGLRFVNQAKIERLCFFLFEHDLINLDVLNKHRKMSKLRTTEKATLECLSKRLVQVVYDLDGYRSSTYFTDNGESEEFFHGVLLKLHPDATIINVTLGVKPAPDPGACA